MNQPRHPSFSVIKAPSALPRPTNSTPKTLFLSGRIPPPQQAQWQNELTNRLQHLPLTILNPLRLDWDSRWEAKTTFAPFNEQVNWELNGLKAADIVVAYFAPDSDCPVTLLEFGLTVAQRAEKVVYNAFMQPGIFESLQQKIDEDGAVRETLRDIVQTLEKQDRATQATLSRAHSTATSELQALVQTAESSIKNEIDTISKLAQEASKYPYYKYNSMWSRQMQDTCFSILFTGYLGGYNHASVPSADIKKAGGRLLTIEQVGTLLHIPVNLKSHDAFHLSIEEYLHAMISLIDELARLARNTVTMADYERAAEIAIFIKNVHAGFQILNLKNDGLRKRSDGIKYRVKEVEDVVYDLSLRGLVARGA
ncbi:hypothetical protein MBLNU457_6642t1 [Dothideomycetes sp. NU457]